MKYFFWVIVSIVFSSGLSAQIRTLNGNSNGFNGLNQKQLDSLNNDEITVKIKGKTKYTDYKIISHQYDSTYIDTTLTIKKDYNFNFLRKDNFELLPFHNQGQTFNRLVYSYSKMKLYPDIGFNSKHFNYVNFDDVLYYQVPTPTTEIMYKTGQEQGQVLEALFTVNFSKRFNISLKYKGLRSLGQYRESLSSSGSFRTTLSYQTPKKQYELRVHYASQNFINQESGGLTVNALESFVTEDPDFDKRGRLETNLQGVETTFEGERFYIDHNFKLFSSADSTNIKKFTNLKIGHEFRYEEKDFTFDQKSEINTDIFGESSAKKGAKEVTSYSLTDNTAYLEFNSKYVLGSFKVKTNYTNISYGYDTIMSPIPLITKKKLKGNALSFGASWNGKIGKLTVNSDAMIIPGSGHLSGNYIGVTAFYKKDSVFMVKGKLLQASKAPRFTAQLFQNSYERYNWNHDFKNVDTRDLEVSFLSKWMNASLNFTNIDDYVYFDQSHLPKQYDGQITYLKLKANKEFSFWKFALDNSVIYQNVISGQDVFRVPDLVARNTFYFTDSWFKGNPLLVNIGATLNYFTKYKMNAFDPILSEFILQDQTEIGFPTLDVFFNARVRRTRIFFKIDNVTSYWTKKNYFSAPNYPYRDFSIRFGLVWNWFI